MKHILTFISILLFIGCASTPKEGGQITDKQKRVVPKRCYVNRQTCVEEQTFYYLIINGTPKAVYKDEFDKYAIGQQYPQ